jgi:hypothetical protein
MIAARKFSSWQGACLAVQSDRERIQMRYESEDEVVDSIKLLLKPTTPSAKRRTPLLKRKRRGILKNKNLFFSGK